MEKPYKSRNLSEWGKWQCAEIATPFIWFIIYIVGHVIFGSAGYFNKYPEKGGAKVVNIKAIREVQRVQKL